MATDEEKMAQMTEAEIKESARAGISRDIESEQRRLAEVGEGFTEQAAAIRRGAAEALGAQLGRQRGMSGATLAGAAEAGVRAREQAALGLSQLQQRRSEMERQAEKRQLELQEKLLKIGTPEERERETIRDVDAEAQAYDEGTDRGKFYEREAEAATTQAERDKLLNRARDELVKDFWFKRSGASARQKYITDMNKKFGPVAGSSTVGS
jgi:hypothetical protein